MRKCPTSGSFKALPESSKLTIGLESPQRACRNHFCKFQWKMLNFGATSGLGKLTSGGHIRTQNSLMHYFETLTTKKLKKNSIFILLPVDDGSDGKKIEMTISIPIVAIYHPWKFEDLIFIHLWEIARTKFNLKSAISHDRKWFLEKCMTLL